MRGWVGRSTVLTPRRRTLSVMHGEARRLYREMLEEGHDPKADPVPIALVAAYRL